MLSDPVRWSREYQALGGELWVIDPRRTEIARAATLHLQLRPGTNVALINAMAHVIATEGLLDEAFIKERCDRPSFADWLDFIRCASSVCDSLCFRRDFFISDCFS